MLVMPANNSGTFVGWLAGTFPKRIGHLYSPGGERGPWPFIPYALDNGAFACWTKQKPFDVLAWRDLLDWASRQPQAPLWVLVPDVVGDRKGTLEAWKRFAPEAKERGWPLAFAAQDGMTPKDVPRGRLGADVVFIGGTDAFKWNAVVPWCQKFPHVHVGRVNSGARLHQCHAAGVTSCDGTGWMRGDPKQLAGLIDFLEDTAA